MCLYDKKRFRLTLKPIKVYKIVKVTNGEFFSPFQETKLNKYMFGYPGHPTKLKYYNDNNYEFGKGFIHAYTSLEVATRDLKLLNGFRPWCNFAIITGYIPRFIRYAKDESLFSEAICARIIIFSNLNKKE